MTGADNMNADREYFYELVNKVPEAKLEELRKALLIMAMPEEAPTEEEIEAIKKGEEQIAKGEFTRYESFDELIKDIMGDDVDDDTEA